MDRQLSNTHGCHVVITLGRCGMFCAERSGGTWHLPAAPTEVRDVCGAGDTVLAALAVALITGTRLRQACQAAMVAAGGQAAAVVALGRRCLVCAERSGATWHLPATPTEVRDVCGAGDTVFAALAVGMVTGETLHQAFRFASAAAGRQASSLGIAAVA